MVEPFGNIIAVMVAYNSGPELRENIAAILPQVGKLILVDNSTEASVRGWVQQLGKEFPIEVISNGGRNIGLGAAQNIGIRRAHSLGADWVLLMDDDSLPDPRMVETLKQVYAAHPDPACVGLLAARIIDVSSGKRYPCLTMHSRWWVTRENMDGHAFMDTLLAMASGSLIRMDCLKQVGLMREDFLIDFIDWEFALRLRNSGWTLVQARDAILNHRLGAQTNHRFLGRSFVTTNYPPFRRYTTARNRILFWRLNFRELPLGCFIYQCLSAGYETLVILLFEKGKWPKIKEIIRGTWAGLSQHGLERAPPSL